MNHAAAVLDTGVVITMAGAGSRFAEAGYTQPKYEVEVHGRTLFDWSMRSLTNFIDAGCPFTFVARDVPGATAFIEKQCRALGIRISAVLVIDRITDGQATTAMLAGSQWTDVRRPIAIYNIDTCVDPSALPLAAVRGAGWLPCFPGKGDKWSFAAADANGRVKEVREKLRVSPHATIGLYWFDSFERYRKAYYDYYSDPRHIEAHERYIAPLYNQLIRDGADVFIHEVPAGSVHGLGTPEDVDVFRAGPMPAVSAATAK